MKDSKGMRPSIGWTVGALTWAMVGGAQVVHAQTTTNLVQNPNFERVSNTVLPNGYTDQPFFSNCQSGEDPRSKIAVRYAYGVDVQTYIEVELTNHSASCVANYNLFMPVSGGRIQVTPGASYEFSGSVQMVAHDGTSGGDIGYNLENASGGYVGGSGSAFSSQPGAFIVAKNVYQAGVPVNGTVPAQILPGLSRYNLQPGKTVRFRLRQPSILAVSAPTAVRIGGLVNPTLLAANGKPFKLTVPISPIAVAVGAVDSTLSLVDANGAVAYAQTRATTYLNGSSWLPVVDGWQFTLPASTSLLPGRYAIRYTLNLPASQTAAGAGATAVTVNGTKAYEVGQLIVDNKAGIYVGQHFHRHPGPADTAPTSPVPIGYQFARSLNHDGTSDPVNGLTYLNWWKQNSASTNWTLFDAWAKRHAGYQSTATKKLLITFFGSPNWLSSAPALANDYGAGAEGLTAAPRDLVLYKSMVSDVVSRYKDRIFAVECWNEPDLGFFMGDPNKPDVSVHTQLADVCKAIYTATKAIDPSIATICPQVAKPEEMKTWLGAKTSQLEPLTDFCDIAGAHTYSRNGSNARGVNYGPGSLADTVRGLRTALSELGVSKPIAVTEAGFYDGVPEEWTDGKVFSSKTGAERAEVIYQTVATARELGVTLFGLYSYDGGADKGAPAGLEGNKSSNAADNTIVNQRMTAAVTDLGVAGVGLQAPEVHLFQLPSQTNVSLAKGNQVSFSVTVVNPGLLPLKNVALSDAASSTKLTLTSAAGTGATCAKSGAQLTCTVGELKAGAAVTVKFNGTLGSMPWLSSSYTVKHAVSVQWNLPAFTTVTKTATDSKTLTVKR